LSHNASFQIGDRIVPENAGTKHLRSPYYLLYILHTPRGEAQPGRYQSPALSLPEVKEFLAAYGSFLSADSRYDLWAHSPDDNGTVVWDRHNQLFCYGPLDAFAAALLTLGFTSGASLVPTPHMHHYRPEFNHLAKGLIGAFNWSYSPLMPEDEQ
jgi:hypothetical protein